MQLTKVQLEQIKLEAEQTGFRRGRATLDALIADTKKEYQDKTNMQVQHAKVELVKSVSIMVDSVARMLGGMGF